MTKFWNNFSKIQKNGWEMWTINGFWENIMYEGRSKNAFFTFKQRKNAISQIPNLYFKKYLRLPIFLRSFFDM